MAFKMNQISCDLASYPYYMLLSPRKFGKTTWWRNLVVAAWGNASKGLLISCGTESGFHHLDNLQVEEALTWDDDYDEETDHRGLVQIVDDLIENNADYGIKGVCFDTFDTLFDIATDEVMRESRRETGKSCKSINDAFGGYNRGSDRLIKIINDQLSRIRNAGIAVFILSHTKFKERTDPLTGEKYEQLTNLMQDRTYSAIADNAQMVMVGTIERDIASGKIENEKRVIHLRGTSTIDAGSRFNDLPETITLDPQDFLAAFKQGVAGAHTVAPVTDKQIDAAAKAEQKAAAKQAAVARKKRKPKSRPNRTNLTVMNITTPSSMASPMPQMKSRPKPRNCWPPPVNPSSPPPTSRLQPCARSLTSSQRKGGVKYGSTQSP